MNSRLRLIGLIGQPLSYKPRAAVRLSDEMVPGCLPYIPCNFLACHELLFRKIYGTNGLD